jgi:fumarylpyruvate hydrolase
MPRHVFDLTTPSLPLVGRAEHFPVRRIWCVGSNYRKPGRDYATREPPYFFSKQPDMIVPDGGTVPHPGSGELRFEVELVIAIGARGKDIAENDASRLIFGYATGLDMTRRDLLLAAQEASKPWEIGKAFEASAPVGAITPSHRILTRASIRLTQNGALRQDSDVDQLIWSVPEIVARLSGLVTLDAGDLIFTGTPGGHGPCITGDSIEGTVDGLEPIRIAIT